MSGVEDRLLTAQEVADFLGLSLGTVRNMVSARRLTVVRISRKCVRIRLSTLERFVASKEQKAVA